ncbi:hypothetical protein BU183_14620 [Enterococcus faecium]|nr:hypothetical protein BU183_14620 [Enterococcus faecium]
MWPKAFSLKSQGNRRYDKSFVTTPVFLLAFISM